MSDIVNTLINDKWENILPTIPSNYIDLIITSPPYNVNLGSNRLKKDGYDEYDDNISYEEYLGWMTRFFIECNRVLKSGGRMAINIGDKANGCYDDKTEILTKKGWKFFSDLQKEDYVITLNVKTKEIEWHNPSNIQKFYYSGDIFNIKTSRIDMAITPNHRMLVEKYHTSGYFIEEMQKLDQYQYHIPASIGKYKNEEEEDFVLKSMYLRNRKNKEIPSKKIKMEDFSEFLGWYISEGCCSCSQKDKFRITISQSFHKNKEKFNRIVNCVKRMGYHPNIYRDQIRINDKQLCYYLDQNIPKYSHNKLIPDIIMNSSFKYSKIFLDSIIDGDGCHHCNGQIRYYTSSKILAGQIQAIGLKVGLVSTLSSRDRENCGNINGRKIKGRFTSYEITFSNRKNLCFSKKNLSKINYNGFVYCCSVPNTIIYVKRNRFSAWCGNSIPTHSDFTQIILNLHKSWDTYARLYKHINPDDIKKFQMMTTIVWHKKQIGNVTSWGSWKSPSSPSFPTPFEFILIFAKEKLKHEGEDRIISVSKEDFMRNSRALWEFPPETRKTDHPCPFPEELPRRLIDQLTYEEDIVLDPFSGTATTCAVAKQMNRHYIGIEMSEKYHSMGIERLSQIPMTKKIEINGIMVDVPDWLQK